VLSGATPSVNGNVAFARIGGVLCAVTDGSQFAARIDPVTLDTLGVLRFDDALSGATASGREAPGLRRATTAHYLHDPADGALYNYFAQFGPSPGYSFFRIRDGDCTREPLGELATDAPAFVHAFGLTERYFVFPEFPLVCDQDRLAAGEPYGASLVWRSGRATRIHVLDRHDASRVSSFELQPFFVMHAVNAFERGNEIVWDVAAYANGEHVRELYLEPGRRPAGGAFAQARVAELRSHARLVRLRLPLAGGRACVEQLSGRSVEFPVLPDAAGNGRPTRTLFSSGFAGDGPGDRYYNQLARFDLESGAEALWHEPGNYAGEPVFVPRPGGPPDEGVVLAAALDAERECAYLAVLDAATFALRARAWLPCALPFAFHGCFVPRDCHGD
jgi:carotenoid cleavage dioxygenase-like enzyme